MLGNEFYVGAFKDGDVWRTNKFMDVSHFPMPMASTSSPHMRVWERRLLYCVPVSSLLMYIKHAHLASFVLN